MDVLSGKYGNYEEIKNTPLTGISRKMMADGTYWEAPAAANEMERLGEMLRKLTDEELDAIQKLGAQAQSTGQEIAQIDKQVTRAIGRGSSNSRSTGVTTQPKTEERALGRLGLLQAEASRIQGEFKYANNADEYRSLVDQLKDINREIDQIISKDAPLKAALNLEAPAVSAEAFLQNARVLGEQGKVIDYTWTDAVSAVGALGSALQGIDDPAAKVMGIIAQAVANIALTFSKALAGDTMNTWEWIAAAASGTATMISTITAIKSATSGSYANGGIIPGNSPSGDNLIANVNSGELILNKAQQANLAAQLTNNNMFGSLALQTTIHGEDIRVALYNSNRRRGGGRGEYAYGR